MSLRWVLFILYILYCSMAGALLIFAPWSPLWQRFLLVLPQGLATEALALAPVRSAITGFGLVHLVWVLHDLEGLFLSAPRDEQTEPSS
jgi:hypothetical protein